MTHRKSILGFSITAAIALIGMVTTTSLNAQAQPDSSQQIRNYLIKAIQSLDNGDNSEAIRQLQLATDQIGTFAAVSGQSPAGQNVETVESDNGAGESNNDEGENDDEEEGSEEGEGEDADEPGDVDTNDEED
jgi:lipopolysaccharide export LptBFGC system permease protein LptF